MTKDDIIKSLLNYEKIKEAAFDILNLNTYTDTIYNIESEYPDEITVYYEKIWSDGTTDLNNHDYISINEIIEKIKENEKKNDKLLEKLEK